MMLVVSPVRHTLQSGLCGRYDLCFGSCLATSSQPFQVLKRHMSRVMRPVKALMAVGVDRLGWWHSFKRDSPGITQDVWALWKGICIQAVFHKAFDSSKSEISGEQQGVVRGQFCLEKPEASRKMGVLPLSGHMCGQLPLPGLLLGKAVEAVGLLSHLLGAQLPGGLQQFF